MFFMLVAIALIVWIACINSKISALSKSVDMLSKSLSDLALSRYVDSQNNSQPKVKDDVVEEAESEIFENQVTEAPQEEQPVVECVVSSENVTEEKVEVKNEEETSKKSRDVQAVIIGNWFNKIGALAIIIAMIIMVKLVSGYFVITEEVKFCIGLLVSGLSLGVGFYLRTKEKFKTFAEVVFGIGFAIAFIMFFCGYSLWHLYQAESVLVIGGMILSVMFLIAHSMKTPSLPIIALIGGYLTPLCAQGTFDITFGYVIFLNAVSLIFTLRNKNYKFLNLINLLITMPIVLIGTALHTNVSIVYPLIFWMIYLVYDLLRDKTSLLDNVYTYFNYAILTFITLIAFNSAHGLLAIMFGVTALGYLILSLVSRVSKNDLYKMYESFCLVNIWLFVLFELNDMASVLTWAGMALVIALFVKFVNQNHLAKFSTIFALSSFAGALLANVGGHHCLTYHYNSVLNIRALIFLIPSVLMFISARLLKDSHNTNSNILKLSGVSLLYIYLFAEIASLIAGKVAGMEYVDFTTMLSAVVVGLLYSLNLKKLEQTSKSVLLPMFSALALIVSLFMLFCLSFWYPEGYVVIFNMRFLAYVLAIATLLINAKMSGNVLYKVLAILFGFMLVSSESIAVPKLYGEGWTYIISLSWALYSALITVAGILTKRKYLLNTGIAIFLITIIRIFVFDLAFLEPIFKLIAFMALGLLLMFVSFMYIKYNNK